MKVKVIGKELIKQPSTGKAWTNFHLVTDIKCNAPQGSTYGGNVVMTQMLNWDKSHDSILIGKEYETVTEERLARDAKGNQILKSVIVDLV